MSHIKNNPVFIGNVSAGSFNSVTLTASAVGFTMAGGTTSKTLTISNTLTLAGTDGSTLNIGVGGTLGSAAYTLATAYESALGNPAANGYILSSTTAGVRSWIPNTGNVGGLDYQGTWNASTNTPALVNGVGTKGHYYKVATAGNTTIDGNSNWTLGDLILYNGTTWDKVEGGSSDVISVNGQTGTVIITNIAGTAASFTGNLTGDVTSTGMATTIAATVVTGKLLTNFSLGTDSSQLAATDSILVALQKLQYQKNIDLTSGISTKTTTYNPTVITDKVILCDAASGAFAITLQASPVNGQSITFKKIDATTNAITINGNGKNIDGVASYTLSGQWNSITLVYNGTAWFII
jgi:hypothetical protein